MPTKVFSIAPTYAVEYQYFDEQERSQWKRTKPPPRTGTAIMSKESRKKLMNALQWMKLFSPKHRVYCKQRKQMVNFKLNFITLTLSSEQVHPDKHVKDHMLMPFLKWMARQGATCYVWKAEAQNNGNIHFHITTNHYLYWKSVRNKWNQLQQDHGYLRAYFKEHGHHDANSTDIHAVRSDRDIANYMGKYFGKLEYWCKNKGERIPKEMVAHPSRYIDSRLTENKEIPVLKRQIDGRKWAVSNNLANIKCFLTEHEANYMENTGEFLRAQNYTFTNKDYAFIWHYPHLIDSGVPNSIFKKLQNLCYKVHEPD